MVVNRYCMQLASHCSACEKSSGNETVDNNYP